MKKLLFCAVALTAFSFSTMANNEVEGKEKDPKEEKVVKINVCDKMAADKFDDEMSNGSTIDDAYDASSEVYNDCIDLHEKHDIELQDCNCN